MPNTKFVGIIFPYILTPIPNLYDHSFPRYGQITFLTFRRPTTLTFDLKFWKYLSVTVYPYVICMPSFIMIGWEMAEILHFEILRKHGQTHTQTDRQTDMGITIPRPPPMGGEVISEYHVWLCNCGGWFLPSKLGFSHGFCMRTKQFCSHTEYVVCVPNSICVQNHFLHVKKCFVRGHVHNHIACVKNVCTH